MDRAERERVERRKRNAELEAHLLRKGTDPETACWLAEQSEPENDVQVGETEATPARRPGASRG